MKLTENQKEFLLNYFFKNESFAGWKSIATKLLDNGSCIVAGNDCIWKGGIGNFIRTEEAEDAVDCIKYSFAINYFLSSEWFKQIHNSYIVQLAQKRIQQQRSIEIYQKPRY